MKGLNLRDGINIKEGTGKSVVKDIVPKERNTRKIVKSFTHPRVRGILK